MGWLRRALIDPVTRAAGLALTQYAVLALDSDFAAGPPGGDFALLTRFVWIAVVAVCVAATAPWVIRATLHLPRAAGYNFAELRFALVFSLAA